MNLKENKVVDKKHEGSVPSELLPTKERIMGGVSYTAAFLGGCVSIGTFSMGASLIGILNLTQAILAMVIGCLVIAVAMVLIGNCGHKYGIPYTIQLRSSFGIKGVKIPGLLRAVPAIVWFGFQSWVGAGAINSCLDQLFGVSNLPVVFVLFTILQIALAINGFQGIKWLENISAIFILATLAYMFYVVVTRYGADITSNITNIEGTWGLPFWAGTTAFLGIYSTMIINASDYSRELKENIGSKRTGTIYAIAILPATLFMGLIGLMVTAATGNSDPVSVFSTTLDNQFLTIVTLLFIAFAQVTTNVLNNVLPPIYVLMDTFKLDYKKSVVLVGVLSVCTCPWLLVTAESAGGLALFTQIYSAFLGPIFAIMVVDYYILRRQKLDLDVLYNKDSHIKGFNLAAILAIAIGAIVSLIFVNISWYVSLIPTAVAYYLLMKVLPQAEPFRKGTILE